MRVSTFVVSGLVVAAACGGGGGGTAPGGGGGGGPLVHAQRVTATTAFTFDPSAVSIPAKDSVFFTFQSIQHSVVFETAGSPPDVGNTTGATVKRAFPTAGTYAYHCGIHPNMKGTVTVTP